MSQDLLKKLSKFCDSGDFTKLASFLEKVESCTEFPVEYLCRTLQNHTKPATDAQDYQKCTHLLVEGLEGGKLKTNLNAPIQDNNVKSHAIFYAQKHANSDLVTRLLKLGASLNVADSFHYSPLDFLNSKQLEGYFDHCVEFVENIPKPTIVRFKLGDFEQILDNFVVTHVLDNARFKHLIEHPLIVALISLKFHQIRWVRFMHHFFNKLHFLALTLHLMFLTSTSLVIALILTTFLCLYLAILSVQLKIRDSKIVFVTSILILLILEQIFIDKADTLQALIKVLSFLNYMFTLSGVERPARLVSGLKTVGGRFLKIALIYIVFVILTTQTFQALIQQKIDEDLVIPSGFLPMFLHIIDVAIETIFFNKDTIVGLILSNLLISFVVFKDHLTPEKPNKFSLYRTQLKYLQVIDHLSKSKLKIVNYLTKDLNNTVEFVWSKASKNVCKHLMAPTNFDAGCITWLEKIYEQKYDKCNCFKNHQIQLREVANLKPGEERNLLVENTPV